MPSRSADAFKSHGYCLSQAMRFAVEEINNSSSLLPNITLGYDIHDTCSEAANLHATLCTLIRKGGRQVEVLPTFHRYEPEVVAVIGPDSTRLALTTAAILGVFLVPEVSAAPPADREKGSRGVMVGGRMGSELRSQAELELQPLPALPSWQAGILLLCCPPKVSLAAAHLALGLLPAQPQVSSGEDGLPVPVAPGVPLPGRAQPPFSCLPLQISYEATLETLSLKRFYPSFLRTIPSDRQQVKAIFLLLQRFGWTWVALLGSDNAYGRDGLNALYKLLTASDVCVAYRGIIPINKDANSPELHNLVRILKDIRVNVTVVFANRRSVHPFFEVVVQRNITGMVWVGSEDWSLARTIWQVPGIQSIGSVIGMSVEKIESAMLQRFEAWKAAEDSAAAECTGRTEAGGGIGGNAQLDCTQRCTGCRLLATVPDMYDAQASFNVYSAVYTVAHGLHDLLGCASGVCSKGTVYPWQVRATGRRIFLMEEDTRGYVLTGKDFPLVPRGFLSL